VAHRRQKSNPFYVLLVVIGIAFTVTASAYFVMTLRGTNASRLLGEGSPTDPLNTKSALVDFMDRDGAKLLTAELVLLALATCGAMGTDSWWSTGDTPRGDVAQKQGKEP